jgi:OmpA-OmpF porin, OOP family
MEGQTMSVNILQLVMGALTPAIMGKLGGFLGESPEATQKGLSGALPAILGSLISKGGDAKGAEGLLDLIGKANLDGGLMDKLGDMLGGGDATSRMADGGQALTQQLLGDRAGGVGELIARFSGMGGGSVQKLLSLAAPLVLGGLMKQAPAGGFSPAGLMGFLASQKEHVTKMLPPGLSGLAGLVGMETPAAPAPAPAPTPARVVPTPAPPAAPPAAHDEPGSGRNILWMLALGALALLGAIYGPRQCAARDAGAPAAVATPGTLALPGGSTITVPPGSIGDQLFQFLQGEAPAPQRFVFDNLTFQSGGSTLTPESVATVDAIGAILSAFPSAQVTLDGYTDNTGTLGTNQRISTQRAEAVAAMLVERGVAAARISATGHGPANPVADNATEEGRARNRRIELNVTAK